MSVVIRKGEQLTHEDGTPYAVANRDIYAYNVPEVEDFDFADGSRPEPHSLMPKTVFRVDNNSGVPVVSEVNIDGKWRKLSELSRGKPNE